jgi:hypothetical protein
VSSDLRDELAQATREYAGFKYGPAGDAAARGFRARLARLEMIGAPARDALERQLTSADAPTRNAAARVLAGMTDLDAAARLIAAFLRHDRPQLDASTLARLGKAAHLPPSMLPTLDQVRPFERGALVRTLFRQRSTEAEQLIEPIFAGFESTLAEAAIDGMATWGDPSWLRDVMARPPMTAPRSLPRDFHPVDVRPHAAYHLALAGDGAAIEALRAWAGDRSSARAAQAVMRLSWLAHPDGIAPAAKLLRRSRGEALELALDAAEVYRSPALVPALFALAERVSQVAEEAHTAIAWIVDRSTTEQPTITRLRPLAEALDPERRFACGMPLTLAVLAAELTSGDAGPRIAAAYNLRAITGEDHGFDLEDDLAGNLTAIEAWRERARDPAPVGAGGWAFRDTPLPPPPPLP